MKFTKTKVIENGLVWETACCSAMEVYLIIIPGYSQFPELMAWDECPFCEEKIEVEEEK